MKGASKFYQRGLALFVAICMAIAIPMAYAVVKNVSIVDNQGNSLANTKVTIVFPDGTEVEEETDDDGMLIYDFPDDGDYTINYPGGQTTVNVSGGIATWVWVAAGVATAGAAAGIYAIVDDDSDGGGSGGGGTVDPCQGNTFNFINGLTATVSSNPGGHPNNFPGDWEFFCDPGVDLRIINVSTGNMSVDWMCPVGTGGACNASVDCLYEGISTICELTSTIGASTWSGQMTAGSDGGLPGGQAITVDFNATL